jgi:hypothetical protein
VMPVPLSIARRERERCVVKVTFFMMGGFPAG